MTQIKIFRQNKSIIGFECSGHTGYDVEGSDIVCAAISTLTLTCILGLEKVQNQNVDVMTRKAISKLFSKQLTSKKLRSHKFCLRQWSWDSKKFKVPTKSI